MNKLTHIPKIQYLSETVISILGCNPDIQRLLGTNTYLVGLGKERALIDTGDKTVPEYITILKQVLKKTESSIKYIIVTHSHADHINGVPAVRSMLSENVPVFKYYHPGPLVADILNIDNVTYIEDQHQFQLDGCTLTAHYNPGHSEDHIILHHHDDNAVFTADSVLGEGTTTFVDFGLYMKSLHQIKDLKAAVLYPGHGPVVRNPDEHLDYYIKHRLEREDQIVKLLQEREHSVTARQLVEIIYANYDPKIWVKAEQIVSLHLKKLLDEDRVEQNGDLWNIVKTPL